MPFRHLLGWTFVGIPGMMIFAILFSPIKTIEAAAVPLALCGALVTLGGWLLSGPESDAQHDL